jgi:hypothetical protein
MRLVNMAAMLAAGAALALPGLPVRAASHSDAPLIKLDPQANLTDVYAFIRIVNGVKVLNVIVNCRPFSNPGDGVTYEKFSDDALYSIHIADPATGATRMRYDFRFSPVGTNGNYKNLNTILNYGLGTEVGPIEHVGDARQNFVQTYTVTRVVGNASTLLHTSDNRPLMCPPPNVGPRTTPYYNDTDPNSPTYGKAISGATSRDTLDRYTRETLYDLTGGETVFCGSRDDSFFADTPAIFDLLNPRFLDNNGSLGDGLGQDGNGVDDFKGYNVLTYSIRVPVSSLGLGSNPVVGVYASVSRPRITLRKSDGESVQAGPWVQVNRMGNPLFNEVLVALKDKDNYNRDSPVNDAKYAKYALNPEVAALVNAVYGTSFVTTNRTDLKGIFIPDVLRVDTSTGAVPVAGEPAFNRLSFIGGDTTDGKPSGWPNGRRVGDDVVDIALTAIASGPTFSTITIVGDNVDHNDEAYNVVFPYVATPHSGTFIRHDPGN